MNRLLKKPHMLRCARDHWATTGGCPYTVVVLTCVPDLIVGVGPCAYPLRDNTAAGTVLI
jgi:hypothetical protein